MPNHNSVHIIIQETYTSISVGYLECDFTIKYLLYNYTTYSSWWNIHFAKSIPPCKAAILKKKLQCKTYIVAALDLFPLLLTILLQSNFISGLLFNIRSSSPQYFDIYKLPFPKSPLHRLSCKTNLCPTLLEWNRI